MNKNKGIEWERRLQEAREYLEFCANIYKIQADGGSFFVHEHPQAAKSWDEPCMKALLRIDGVHDLDIDQCMYGLVTDDGNGWGGTSQEDY